MYVDLLLGILEKIHISISRKRENKNGGECGGRLGKMGSVTPESLYTSGIARYACFFLVWVENVTDRWTDGLTWLGRKRDGRTD